jgi:endo-1,4-beta-xylanase
MLVGRQATGEWWEGLRRLDIGVQDQQVKLETWNNSPTANSQTFSPTEVLEGVVELELIWDGSTFHLFRGPEELGSVEDFGLLEDGVAWLGTNVGPGNQLTVFGLAVGAPNSAQQSLEVVTPVFNQPAPARDPSLRKAAEGRGLQIGAAVNPDLLSSEQPYRETLGSEYNMVVAENVMKWSLIHPEPDRYNFCPADVVVSNARANDMKIRGHTLVWHNQNPSWLEDGNYSREELIAILKAHIFAVAGRYRGEVAEWDVVNEAISDNGGLRSTVWLDGIGPEYIEMAFRWAHEADSSALLFYNDYSIAETNTKSTAVYNLIDSLLKKGVPVHGVGFQAHVGTTPGLRPTISSIQDNIERFAELGLLTNFTEIDVRIFMPASESELSRQADIYSDLLGLCIANESCTSFVMWGFTDKHSWIPSFFEGYGAALIFDEHYQPKPAHAALLETLSN